MIEQILKQVKAASPKKEKSLLVELVDELAVGAAAVIGGATGLTPDESKKVIENKENPSVKTEETKRVAKKVAIAQDLENLSRQNEVDGLTNSNKQKYTQKQQQELSLNKTTSS